MEENTSQTITPQPPVQTSSSSKKSPLIIVLIVLLVVGLGAGLWYVQQQKVTEAQNQLSAIQTENDKLQTKVTELEAGEQSETGATAKSDTSVATKETDKQQIQRVTKAYLNRSKAGKDSDKADFDESKEKTTIKDRFAIQYYCGEGSCSQAWLKKVGNTWLVLDVGLALESPELNTLGEEYGWPATFTK